MISKPLVFSGRFGLGGLGTGSSCSLGLAAPELEDERGFTELDSDVIKFVSIGLKLIEGITDGLEGGAEIETNTEEGRREP